MVCTHLRELYDLCEKNQLRLGSSDLIRIVCTKCDMEDTCPSVLIDEFEAREQGEVPTGSAESTDTAKQAQTPPAADR